MPVICSTDLLMSSSLGHRLRMAIDKATYLAQTRGPVVPRHTQREGKVSQDVRHSNIKVVKMDGGIGLS
jgi:hypothetical protein